MPIFCNEEARRKAGFLLFPDMGRVGLEPTTLCLKGTCSAIELTARRKPF